MASRVEARADFHRRLLDAARRRMAADGAAGLGMRVLARDLGVTPGALYRYVRSRDDLLTLLVIDSYTSLGDAAAEAESAVPRSDVEGRWVAVWLAVHAWAGAHPHEYALIHGTPVAGYRAPQETVGPGTRLNILLARIAVDLPVAEPPPQVAPLTGGLADDVQRIRNWLATQGITTTHVPDPAILAVAQGLSTLIGTIGLELFGHFKGGFENPREFVAHAARRSLAEVSTAMGHVL
ncbi:TetR/AcrR family transcriptional regulator [Arachnia propionica]|uniref:TetR/AcrR family transcriptional regulator n=1 Tax=Arachnia propionica TaxID=1750 RepID=A0A3P1T5V1_9ACTN|nr:TetR/AcrR family transcriptional regulator [Arachnia propionica]RRD04678.1 TetR/AcrR family transcriptional regulator [Arachnia propionica]